MTARTPDEWAPSTEPIPAGHPVGKPVSRDLFPLRLELIADEVAALRYALEDVTPTYWDDEDREARDHVPALSRILGRLEQGTAR